jgi:hypothetical protein
LEVIRREAGLSVRRFRELAGISESTWYRQRARAFGGRPTKGPWPRPTRDRVAAVVHAYALRYPAWGHRKIWALTVADGHELSMRTVHRILDERGLLNGRRYQAERRELAKVRRQTFHEPPTRRNRVWQTDFSEIETRAGGTWQLSGVLDYVTKFCLTCPVTATKTWREAVGALEAARERAGEALGAPLIQDLVDRASGELFPISFPRRRAGDPRRVKMAGPTAPLGRLTLRGEGEFPRRTRQLQASFRSGGRGATVFPLGS